MLFVGGEVDPNIEFVNTVLLDDQLSVAFQTHEIADQRGGLNDAIDDFVETKMLDYAFIRGIGVCCVCT